MRRSKLWKMRKLLGPGSTTEKSESEEEKEMPPFDCEPLTLTFSLKETPELDQIFGYEALEPMPKEDNFYPEKIIKSGLVTVVLWKDGTKTVVRCAGDETYSLYNAFVSALAKKVYGSNSAVKRIIDNAVTVQKPKKKPEME